MWVIYDPDSFDILSRHYSKDKAKIELKYFWKKHLKEYAIDRVDLCRIDEWKTWKALNWNQ